MEKSSLWSLTKIMEILGDSNLEKAGNSMV